jgi:hypothetical protein
VMTQLSLEKEYRTLSTVFLFMSTRFHTGPENRSEKAKP